jgi:hypothetical protein
VSDKTSRIKEAIESVGGGVCKSVPEILQDFEVNYYTLTPEELEDLDSEIFNCSICDWTLPEEENGGEGVCVECLE